MLSAKTNINGTIGILLLSIGQVNDAIQDIEEIGKIKDIKEIKEKQCHQLELYQIRIIYNLKDCRDW